MTYETIRQEQIKAKRSKWHQSLSVQLFDHFAVMTTKYGDSILIDKDIAELARQRLWCLDGHGYPVINLAGKSLRLHDYVLARVHDEKPEGVYVDHINQDKLDNRINNLRFVTPLENSYNVPIKTNNTTGVCGVSKTKAGKYRAYIRINGKQVSLGHYEKIEDAAAARREAEDRLGFKTRPGTIKELCVS